MKKFVSPLAVLGFALLLVSCKQISFNSYLEVNEALTIKGKQNQSLHFEPGKIFIDLSVKNKRTLSLKVFDKKKQEITFSLPRGDVIPPERGSFFVASEELGQDFDLEGTVMTALFDTPSITTVEACTYKETRRVCRNVNGSVICSNEVTSRSGQRSIVTHYEEKETTLLLDFKKPGTSDVVAQFKGINVGHERQLIDMYGECVPQLQ